MRPKTRNLLDVSVPVALLDEAHIHHARRIGYAWSLRCINRSARRTGQTFAIAIGYLPSSMRIASITPL